MLSESSSIKVQSLSKIQELKYQFLNTDLVSKRIITTDPDSQMEVSIELTLPTLTNPGNPDNCALDQEAQRYYFIDSLNHTHYLGICADCPASNICFPPSSRLSSQPIAEVKFQKWTY